MKNSILNQFSGLFCCPNCESSLFSEKDKIKCLTCHGEYFFNFDSGQPDLRLKKRKNVNFKFVIAGEEFEDNNFDFKILKVNSENEINYPKDKIPHHISKELLSYFPKAKSPESTMLDIGCGSTLHREVCEYAGFRYIGLDYNSPEACVLGDAHALPFKENSFEFLLSIAVLEHIQNPFVMLREAHRVLKPGGKLIGTVSFLEPFHGNSFYHHTHLGLLNSLRSADFEIEKIAPSASWHGLKAQANMALFPKLPSSVASMMVLPVYISHRIWWKLGSFLKSEKANEVNRVLYTTGSFAFIAKK